MKSNHWGLVSLAVGLVVGILVGGSMMERSAAAQGVSVGAPAARYQLSAWFVPGPGNQAVGRGCYILDTVTGEVWESGKDGQEPKKISEKIR